MVKHTEITSVYHTHISQGSVATHLKCGGLMTVLSQIVHVVCRWKIFENLPTFGKDIDNSLAGMFVLSETQSRLGELYLLLTGRSAVKASLS